MIHIKGISGQKPLHVKSTWCIIP